MIIIKKILTNEGGGGKKTGVHRVNGHRTEGKIVRN